ncbi:MAG: hypothetical protein OSB09_02150 [Planctomycetota bacterium]|nr:hypothetical protein [Planctomycetota bacterium]
MYRIYLITIGLLFSGFGSTTLQAQSFSAGSDSAAAGGTMNITATLDNTGSGGAVQGWSFGMCHDSSIGSVSNVNDEDSAGVDFNQSSIYVDGWTQGVVICFTGCNPIPEGSTLIMSSADYAIDAAAAPGDYPVQFCNVLGAPPVSTVTVIGGASLAPTQNPGNMEVIDIPGPTFNYIAPAVTAAYNPDDGISSFTADLQVSETDNSALGAPYPNATQGFSMGLGHDSALLEATSVTLAGPVAALDGGNGPDFAESSIYIDGITVGCVYSFVGAETISYTSASTVVQAAYSTVAGALTGDTDGATTTLNWTGGLGSPNVTNVMVVGGASSPAETQDGSITLVAASVTAYLRSDANADGRNDVSDAIWMLTDLFLGGPHLDCNGASDANGDGGFDVADPTFVIQYQFLEGPAPSAPYPSCGTTAGQEPADCTTYPSCG